MMRAKSQDETITSPRRRFGRRFALALGLTLFGVFLGIFAALSVLDALGHLPSWEALIIKERQGDDAAAAAAARLASLEKRLFALEKKTAGRFGYPPPPEIALEEDVAALRTRFQKEIAALRSRTATRSESAAAVSLAAYLALERAALGGRDFDRELAALGLTRRGDPLLKRLGAKGGRAAPTRRALAQSFQKSWDAMAREMSLPASPDWTGRLESFFSRLVSIRRAGLWEGEDAESVLAAMEHFLGQGDLAEAVARGSLLEERGASAPIFEAWMEKARARLALEENLGALSQTILTEIAAEAGAAEAAEAGAAEAAKEKGR